MTAKSVKFAEGLVKKQTPKEIQSMLMVICVDFVTNVIYMIYYVI